jgi:hypothetical protein
MQKNQRKYVGFLEAQTGFEPVNQGVADPRLTTWLLRLTLSTCLLYQIFMICQDIKIEKTEKI